MCASLVPYCVRTSVGPALIPERASSLCVLILIRTYVGGVGWTCLGRVEWGASGQKWALPSMSESAAAARPSAVIVARRDEQLHALRAGEVQDEIDSDAAKGEGELLKGC